MPVDQHVYLVDLLPCPLCGSHDLDAGLQACQCYGIKCRKCRLRLEQYLPGVWPKGVFKKNVKYSENRLNLCKWLMNEIVVRWNLRTANPGWANRRPTEVTLDVVE